MNAINWKRIPYIVLIFAAITSIINWFFSEQTFTLGFVLDCIGKSATVITFFSWIFCQYAWKWKFLRKWLVKVPNLNGEWEGILKSNWINPDTQSELPSQDITLKIKQSLFRVKCTLTTGESTSHSIKAGFIIDDDTDECELIYTYQNDPQQILQDRSRIHYGTAVIKVNEEKNGIEFRGFYFTSRETSGILYLPTQIK